MPYDPELAEQMREALKTRPGIQEKKCSVVTVGC